MSLRVAASIIHLRLLAIAGIILGHLALPGPRHARSAVCPSTGLFLPRFATVHAVHPAGERFCFFRCSSNLFGIGFIYRYLTLPWR